MKKIYVVRHGETDENNKDNDDQLMYIPFKTELNENGRMQAKKTGECLKGKKIQIIISSPTERCKQTAKIIAKEIGLSFENIIEEPNLVELQINDKYKNLTKKEFKELKDTDENVKDYLKFINKINKISVPIELNKILINNSMKDNKIYETDQSMSNKIIDFIDTLKNLKVSNILIISHGGTIKWFTKSLINIIGYDNYQGKLVNGNSYCGITYFIYRDNQFFLISAQSNAHLENK